MRRLTRFHQLSSPDRGLLLRALLAVAAMRTALWVLPVKHLWPRPSACGTGANRATTVMERTNVKSEGATAAVQPATHDNPNATCHPTSLPIDRIIWAIRAASRYIPRATCLTQALAAQELLSRAGHPSRVEIGVAKNEDRKFAAHAWVTCGNRIVIGGPETTRYAPLLSWERGLE